MTDTEKTKALLLQALCDDNLQIPGGCAYVNENGKRCIVSTVLHLVGADDDTLLGDGVWRGNYLAFSDRKDLVSFATERSLDTSLLIEAQNAWDIAVNKTYTNKAVVKVMEKVYNMAVN